MDLIHANKIQDQSRGYHNAAGDEDAKKDAAESQREIPFRRVAVFGVDACVHMTTAGKLRRGNGAPLSHHAKGVLSVRFRT